MGTDIHMVVEKYDWHGNGEEPSWRMVIGRSASYGQRNYDVFAVLADVRNGYGFADCKTGDGFKPISKPRGLPLDLDQRSFEEMKIYSRHSPTWLLLSEVLDYDWTQETRHTGIVHASEFLRMMRADEKKPKSWCGGVTGRDIVHATPEELASSLKALGEPPANVLAALERASHHALEDELHGWLGKLRHWYTQVEWAETYEESCNDFLAWARGLTAKNAPTRLRYIEPAKVRLVFGFDS